MRECRSAEHWQEVHPVPWNKHDYGEAQGAIITAARTAVSDLLMLSSQPSAHGMLAALLIGMRNRSSTARKSTHPGSEGSEKEGSAWSYQRDVGWPKERIQKWPRRRHFQC
jgi:hypothetical protein